MVLGRIYIFEPSFTLQCKWNPDVLSCPWWNELEDFWAQIQGPATIMAIAKDNSSGKTPRQGVDVE